MSESGKPSRRDVLALLGPAAALSLFPQGNSIAETNKTFGSSSETLKAAKELIHRVAPAATTSFWVEVVASEAGHDVFEIESIGSRIILRGNTGVSIASALNHYLKYFCHRQMDWWDRTVAPLPHPLPSVPEKVRRVSPFKYRVYLNYCTFSYTAAWWDWERWQHEIDWMAMHGVNMPLAITGQEAVWQNMLRHFRMNDTEIRSFLCGPAFFAWQWMANLEGWGGPLPQSWIDSHAKLGYQILERERALGMIPILQGFTGFVPRAIKDKYPDAHIQQKPNWCNVFKGTAQLDPLDPLFRQMGTAFLKEQQKLFGTNHIYAADPFHESKPPSDAPDYLPAVAKEILDTMKTVDPQAKIAMQTWSLRKPLVMNITEDRLLLLALQGSGWQKTEGFWERPWACGVLQNYGGRIFMAGSLERALDNALDLKKNPHAGAVAGIGMFPEGTEQNPVFYDAASEIAWMQEAPETSTWLRNEITARYGQQISHVEEAWSTLQHSLYANGSENGSLESPICSRPALFLDRAAPNANFQRHYDPNLVWDAWAKLQEAARELKGIKHFEYDLIDLGRQGLADLSIPLQKNITAAYLKKDQAALTQASAQFLNLAMDMDTMLATRPEFLLGRWLEAAKQCGSTEEERQQYEWNARLQITVWGPSAPNAFLFDYANKQWSGLIRGYYIPRWRQFLGYLATQPSNAERFTGKGLSMQYYRPSDEANDFYQKLSQWEQAWCRQRESYPTSTVGNSVQIASQLFAKWDPVRKVEFNRYDLQKLTVNNFHE